MVAWPLLSSPCWALVWRHFRRGCETGCFRMESINFKRDLSAFLQVLGGAAVLPLMLLGVGGTIYKALAPNGWLSVLLRNGLPDSFAAASALLVMCGFAWLTREWRTPRTRSWVIDSLVYAFAVAGLMYAAQLIANGRL